eukprot:jgi/Pico_ML_1/53120/g3727.t1
MRGQTVGRSANFVVRAKEDKLEPEEIIKTLSEKLPKLMELVGLGYTAWFTYRYLIFKNSRKELVEDIEELKSKIAGATIGEE